MNYRNIIKVLGGLLILVGFSQLICLLYAWLDAERNVGMDAVEAFALAAGISCGTGLLGVLFGRQKNEELLRKEAIAVVGLGWLVCALFGALPYMFTEPRLSFSDAYFEAVSGFTTTGASVIDDLENVPRGILLWRSLTQWLGGMGILVLFVALLSSFRVGSRAIFRHESSAQDTNGIAHHASHLALRLWQIYLGITVICLGGLMLLGLPFFDALCHTFATVSTGGFSTHNESIAFFDSFAVEAWLMAFMIVGSINFVLYAWLLRGDKSRWKQDEESKVFFFILIAATVAIGVDLAVVGVEESWLHAFRVAAFQVVSLMTTSGFATADFGQWPALSEEILLLLMVLGGCAGSTAGGVKLGRWILFIKNAKAQLIASFRPNRIMKLSLNGKPASDALKIDTLFIVGMAGLTLMLGTIVVSFMEPAFDMDSSLSAVLATLFNIGPGLGAVGPTHTFSGVAPYTKIFLSLLMVIGRLEFYAVLVLFMPSLWKKY